MNDGWRLLATPIGERLENMTTREEDLKGREDLWSDAERREDTKSCSETKDRHRDRDKDNIICLVQCLDSRV